MYPWLSATLESPSLYSLQPFLDPTVSSSSSRLAQKHRFCPLLIRTRNMSSLTTHIARRGLELAHGAAAGNDDQKITVSPIAVLVFSVTCLVFLVLFAAVSTQSVSMSQLDISKLLILQLSITRLVSECQTALRTLAASISLIMSF